VFSAMHFECTCSNYSEKFSIKKTTKELKGKKFVIFSVLRKKGQRIDGWACRSVWPRPIVGEAAQDAMLVAVAFQRFFARKLYQLDLLKCFTCLGAQYKKRARLLLKADKTVPKTSHFIPFHIIIKLMKGCDDFDNSNDFGVVLSQSDKL